MIECREREVFDFFLDIISAHVRHVIYQMIEMTKGNMLMMPFFHFVSEMLGLKFENSNNIKTAYFSSCILSL